MPNWCFTKIVITHDDTNELKVFDKLLDQWTSRNYKTNGFGHNWLGNIVLGSGIGTVDTNPETDFECRGTIDHKEIYMDELIIDTSTAWKPMLRMWVELVNKFIPDANITYTAEESSDDLYYTNDPDLEGKYVIDSWDERVESDYEAEESNVIKTLQELLETTESDVDKLIQMSFDKENYVGIHKWEYKNIESFND